MPPAPPVSTEYTLNSPAAPVLRSESSIESFDRTAARASSHSQSTIIYTPRVAARTSYFLDNDTEETASDSTQSSAEHPSSWNTCAEDLSRHSSVRMSEEASEPAPDAPISLPHTLLSKQSTQLSVDSLQRSLTKVSSDSSVTWPDTDASSIARGVMRGLPELRLLKSSKSYDKPSRRGSTDGKETPKAMNTESTVKNVHEPVRAKQEESTDSQMPRQHRPKAPKKPTSLATMRARVTEDTPVETSHSRSQPRPLVTAVLNAHVSDPLDEHGFQHAPGPSIESRARARRSSSRDSSNLTLLQAKQPQPFSKPLNDKRPSQWRSISHDFFYRTKPAHRREASDPQLRRQSGPESAPPSPLALEVAASSEGYKKKRSLRRWMSKHGLFSPTSSSPPLPSASSAPGSTTDSPPMLAARPTATKTAQALQPYVATEARRVTTPPLQTRGGKLHGFYFDFKPPEAPDEPLQGRFSPSFPMPKQERDGHPPKPALVSAPVERDWFRVRMDAIMAEGEDDDDDAEGIEWDVPEHLPGSPLCPLSPKHKSGGKGICVYHGRRKTQHAAEFLMA